MGRFLYADADRPNWRRMERRRQEDLEFLQKVRTYGLDELLMMLRTHAQAPKWKIVALRRAIDRAQKAAREGRRP